MHFIPRPDRLCARHRWSEDFFRYRSAAGVGELLRQKGILYAPDFVINAGGIIKVCYEYLHKPDADVEAHVQEISDTLAQVFTRADREGLPTSVVADEMAEARFKR